MEPTYSLQHHIFKHIQDVTYRDINVYNPLNITHPLTDEYLDLETRSPIGDGKADSINMLVPQDCEVSISARSLSDEASGQTGSWTFGGIPWATSKSTWSGSTKNRMLSSTCTFARSPRDP